MNPMARCLKFGRPLRYLFCSILLLLPACKSPIQPATSNFARPIWVENVSRSLQQDKRYIARLQEQMRDDLFQLAADQMAGRRYNSRGHQLARRYIARRFAQTGLQPLAQGHGATFEVPFKLNKAGINLIGILPATDGPKRDLLLTAAATKNGQTPFILVTAHYDHLGRRQSKIFNGADDNASGVAAILYLAARLKNYSSPFPIMFVATDREEAGLYGSQALFLDKIISADNVALNINVDMVGRRGRGGYLYVGGTRSFGEQRNLLRQTLSQLKGLFKNTRLRTGHDSNGLSNQGSISRKKIDWRKASDHSPFRQRKIRWLFFSDSPHADYHKTTDDAERIDFEYLNDNAEIIFQLLMRLLAAESGLARS